MSATGRTSRDHERARQLAAARLDDVLPPGDEAWLAEHLESCDECAAAAADYDAQHDLFADLRASAPEPPRDLWARTAAAIDAEQGRRSSSWRRLLGTPVRSPRLALAPLVAVAIVVVAVSSGLLNGQPAPGGAPGATPIALSAADVQVIGRDSAGNIQIMTRSVDAVCPVGVSACGVSPTFAVTAVSGLGQASTLQGAISAISPTRDRLVVVARGATGEGVYIVPVPAASAAPTGSGTAVPASPAAPTPSQAAPASPTPAAPSASATPAPATTTEPSSSPASPAPSPSVPAGPSDAASTPPAPSASAEPSAPAPSVAATPAPDAAVQIASGVNVVGTPVYAPDGTHLAFSAMPTDSSTGPDVYVWAVGDKAATPITTDHGSWLAGWTAAGILASRVANGTPSTYLLDPTTGQATAVGAPGTWLPAVAPSGTVAVWWDGTMKLAADGVTWLPDAGKVVIGPWPSTEGSAGTSAPQPVSKGQVAAWQARWTGDAVAVWTSASASGHAGKLSLYRVDPATGAPDLANPMLDNVAASPDFSLRTGRLAWTTPSDAPPDKIEVLAWSGKDFGQMELPADGSGTVGP